MFLNPRCDTSNRPRPIQTDHRPSKILSNKHAMTELQIHILTHSNPFQPHSQTPTFSNLLTPTHHSSSPCSPTTHTLYISLIPRLPTSRHPAAFWQKAPGAYIITNASHTMNTTQTPLRNLSPFTTHHKPKAVIRGLGNRPRYKRFQERRRAAPSDERLVGKGEIGCFGPRLGAWIVDDRAVGGE